METAVISLGIKGSAISLADNPLLIETTDTKLEIKLENHKPRLVGGGALDNNIQDVLNRDFGLDIDTSVSSIEQELKSEIFYSDNNKLILYSTDLDPEQEARFLQELKSSRITTACFETIPSQIYLLHFPQSIKYLRINNIDNPIIFQNLPEAMETHLCNLRGLSIGGLLRDYPLFGLFRSLKSLKRLLFFRISANLGDHDIKLISDLCTNSNLLFLGIHNTAVESISLFHVLLSLTGNSNVRSLDLKGTLIDKYFFKELAQMLENADSLATLTIDDPEQQSPSLLLQSIRKQNLLSGLEITGQCSFNTLEMYRKCTSIVDCMLSPSTEAHEICSKNFDDSKMLDQKARNGFLLANRLYILRSKLPKRAILHILKYFFRHFKVEHADLIVSVLADPERISHPLAGAFPFSSTELLRRCILYRKKKIGYDIGLVCQEVADPNSPDWFHSCFSHENIDF